MICALTANLSPICAQSKADRAFCEKIDDEGFLKVHPKVSFSLESLCLCDGLISLELRKRNLARLADCFENLTQLKKLDLRKSTLSGFPVILLRLQGLEELSLAHTNINFLPENLYELHSLRKLDLQGTSINTLPDGLEHIEVIDFRMCDLNRETQDSMKEQYPGITFFFPSPCNCHH
jgi:Leucine-rich repeat (LRR) protein